MGKPLGFKDFKRDIPKKISANTRISNWKEIYLNWPESEIRDQGSRCMDCGVPFCHTGCPLGNIIPEFNDLVYKGEWQKALEVLHSTNNFPEFTGRICPAPCEAACVLNINQDPVTIEYIEKSIIETGFENGWVTPQQPSTRTGKKVAVVGSGPAGLAAAHQLNKAGHLVTVYERDDYIGGLLRIGIPEFKLEKSVVKKRRKVLEEMGVKFFLGKEIGADINFKDIYKDYDAVFLGMGTYTSLEGGFRGEKLLNVHKAIDYLVESNKKLLGINQKKDSFIDLKGKDVVILGGGDTAMDCNRTAIRQGAQSVTCIYRRDEDNMPGSRKEVINAKEEGVNFVFNSQPIEILGNDKVEAIKTISTRLTDPDHNGRQVPIPITNSDRIFNADAVIIAFGFRASPPNWAENYTINLKQNGLVDVDSQDDLDFQTSNPKIFSGGDMVRGSDLVVTAVWEGREAAKSIIKYVHD